MQRRINECKDLKERIRAAVLFQEWSRSLAGNILRRVIAMLLKSEPPRASTTEPSPFKFSSRAEDLVNSRNRSAMSGSQRMLLLVSRTSAAEAIVTTLRRLWRCRKRVWHGQECDE